METVIKNSYCQTCETFYDDVLIPQCPKCKENSDLVETYHLQSGDRAYSAGCFLEWDGKGFGVYDLDSDTFYDGECVMFDKQGYPFIVI